MGVAIGFIGWTWMSSCESDTGTALAERSGVWQSSPSSEQESSSES